MPDKLAVEVYRDIKRIMKLIIIIFLVALVIFASYFFIERNAAERRYKEQSAALLKKADEAIVNKTAMSFKRDSLGDKSSISIWILDDSDRHIVVEKDGKRSLFTSSISEYSGISAYHVAGEACKSLSFTTDKEFITSVSCDFVKYYTPK